MDKINWAYDWDDVETEKDEDEYFIAIVEQLNTLEEQDEDAKAAEHDLTGEELSHMFWKRESDPNFYENHDDWDEDMNPNYFLYLQEKPSYKWHFYYTNTAKKACQLVEKAGYPATLRGKRGVKKIDPPMKRHIDRSKMVIVETNDEYDPEEWWDLARLTAG